MRRRDFIVLVAGAALAAPDVAAQETRKMPPTGLLLAGRPDPVGDLVGSPLVAGLARGYATIGRIGFEGRSGYAAIGSIAAGARVQRAGLRE